MAPIISCLLHVMALLSFVFLLWHTRHAATVQITFQSLQLFVSERHISSKTSQVRSISSKTAYKKLRKNYVELHKILRIFMGFLRGFYGFLTATDFSTGYYA